MGCGHSKKKLGCVKPDGSGDTTCGEKRFLGGKGKWTFTRAHSVREKQDSKASVSDTKSARVARSESEITPQSAPTLLRLNSGITVHVSSSPVKTQTDTNCVNHQKPFENWCQTCEEPVCSECVLQIHSQINGHVTLELNVIQIQLKDELKKYVNRLSNLLGELHPLQMEIFRCKESDEKLARELVSVKENSCKAVEEIGRQIELAMAVLLQWQNNTNWDNFSTADIFHATQNIKNRLRDLNGISEQLRTDLEGYRVTPTYSIAIDQELESSANFLKDGYSQSSELNVYKKLEKFLISDVFRSNYPFLKGKCNYNGSMRINVRFEHNLNHNPELKKYRNDPKIMNKELKRHLRKYLSHVTQFNARFKAQHFFQVFPIRISNVNVITDAAVDVALSSDHCASMSSFLAYLIGMSAKTIEWHFAADNMPSYLMERCQEELQRELRTVDDNYLQYKRLVRFIGELYNCGLLPAALLEYFLDYLLSRDENTDLYGECVCIMLLTIGPTCESNERRISVDSYLLQLEDRQCVKPSIYIQHLIQHIREMKTNNWSLKECSGISNVNNQQTDIILEYLNSIETAALATEAGSNANRRSSERSSTRVSWQSRDLLEE